MNARTGVREQVVAIGASAGGLAALEAVLAGLPSTFPVPILVVQHLDPDHPSYLARILDRHTDLAVEEAREGAALAGGGVFLGSPDRHLLVGPDRRLTLSRTELVHYVRPSVDELFRSCADRFEGGTIVVVLTGAGRDGADGVRAVHEAGGTVIVQEPETAQFAPMPRAAVQTGCADHVVPLGEVAPLLRRLTAEGDGS